MRILYGVQGTGNGHLSRARVLGKALADRGADVKFLLSGRPADQWPDEPWLHDAQRFHGLTLSTHKGRVRRFKTVAQSRPKRFFSELSSVHAERYDLVISDYEPLSAWSAQRKQIPSIGIGHQYALQGSVPRPRGDLPSQWVLSGFAPTDQQLGLHWHPFDIAALPPMINKDLRARVRVTSSQDLTLVYLPFELPEQVVRLLESLPEHRFVFHSAQTLRIEQNRNITFEPLDSVRFRQNLKVASRVICSTGFMLISEAMHLGIPILTCPVQGQYEQRSNAMVLKQLGIGQVSDSPLDNEQLRHFIKCRKTGIPVHFPDVASAIADWCLDRGQLPIKKLSERLWQQVQTEHPSWNAVATHTGRQVIDPASQTNSTHCRQGELQRSY